MVCVKPWLGCALLLPLFASCQRFDQSKYVAAIRSGFVTIPYALQIEELFGEADHFITHYGSSEPTHTWNTETFIAGRYEFTMQVEVQLDKGARRVEKIVGEPIFYLSEIRNVFYDNGQVGCFYNGSKHLVFGLAEWKKIYESGGDFSTIGYTLRRDDPVENIEQYIAAVREPRIRVRPLKDKKGGKR